MKLLSLALCATTAAGTVYFEEKFADKSWEKRWVPSEWKGDEAGKWSHTAGEWFSEGMEAEATGIATTDDMRHHTISAKMDKAAATTAKPLVVQFSVKHEKKDYSFCGGGYIKLHPKGFDQKKYGGDDEYAIMFGPDLCGYDVSRIHLIFNHKGENLLKEEDIKLDYDDKNEMTHLYTLIVETDGTYEVLLDEVSKASGKLSEEWAFPSESIKDPEQSKPTDWVDTKMIEDPEAKKPEGYDDMPAEIPDPDSEKPDDWDEEDDGEWEPPMIDNPDYKGEWEAPMIENPDYKGEWEHPVISNPDYAPDTYAKYTDLEYVGFELWTVNAGSVFDNVLVTDDKAYATKMAAETWGKIKEGESDAFDAWKKANEPEEEEMDEDMLADPDMEEEEHDEL